MILTRISRQKYLNTHCCPQPQAFCKVAYYIDIMMDDEDDIYPDNEPQTRNGRGSEVKMEDIDYDEEEGEEVEDDDSDVCPYTSYNIAESHANCSPGRNQLHNRRQRRTQGRLSNHNSRLVCAALALPSHTTPNIIQLT